MPRRHRQKELILRYKDELTNIHYIKKGKSSRNTQLFKKNMTCGRRRGTAGRCNVPPPSKLK